MNKLKTLNETVGALKKEIRAYLDSEARKAIADKENDPKLKDLETRFTSAAEDLSAEIRQSAREGAKPIVLSTDERKAVDRFEFSKVLTHLHRTVKGQPSSLDGAEAELLQEGENEARVAGIESTGIMLPRILVRRGSEKRDLTTILAQGGQTIATEKAGLLDDFFNASIMRAAGATVLEGLTGNLDIPRLLAGTAPAAKAENANADEVTPTTAMLSLTPKRLPAYIDISQQLLIQSSAALEAIVKKHLTTQMVAVQEAAFFHGTGTNEATGIAATAGIGSVAGGANGLAPAWTHIVGLETAVDTQNALLGNMHYASNGQTRAKLKQTLKSGADTASNFILNDLAGNVLNGYSPFWTNAISRTLVKGASGSVCSAIFFGDFSDYFIGYWGGIGLEMIRDKPNAIAGLYTLVASAYYDGGVVRPKSFAAMLDSLSA